LSPIQEQQLRRIGRAAHRWRAALAPLAAGAQEQGDAALQGDLAHLDSLLRQLESARQMTFAAYVAALAARNQALELWAASSAGVGPSEEVAWQQADAGATDLATAGETGFVFGADLASGATWTYAESPPAEGGATGGAGMSLGREGAGGPGETASAEPAPASGASEPQLPALPGAGSEYGDLTREEPAATPWAAGSGNSGAMPGSAGAPMPAEPGGSVDEVPVPEADPGALVPAAVMAALDSGSPAPSGSDEADAAAAAPELIASPHIFPEEALSQAGDTSLGLVWEEICRPRPSGTGRPGLCPLHPTGAENL
jgi:hypothetical protein